MGEALRNRFTFAERVVHWLVGVTFVALLVSGLALSYPSLFWLTNLLGGGPAARLLHPWIGAVFGIGLACMFGLWLRDMLLSPLDWSWLGAVRHYVARHHDSVPEAGKYNAGQKLFFWAQGVLGVVFVCTGIVLWFPDSFTAGVLALGRLAHYLATLGGGLLLILHVYLATIAHPGTARAMIDGKVTRSWAKHHHPGWHDEQADH